MTPLAIALIVLVAMFLLGLPIFMSLIISSVVAILAGGDILPLSVIHNSLFDGLNLFPLLAIPCFVVAGTLMEFGNITQQIVDVVKQLVGRVYGGLGITTILACTFFAAISGSGPGTVAAVGTILVPAMVRNGYSKDYASAAASSGGTIGILIPPSNPMIIYAILGNLSVTAMFTAGFIPGFIVAFAMIMTAYLLAKRNGFKGDENAAPFNMKFFLRSCGNAGFALATPFIILGSIYTGWATPVEASVVAIVWALFVGIVINRVLRPRHIYRALLEGAMTCGAVLLIVGMGFFQLGAEISMTPLGQGIGGSIVRQKKTWLAVVICFAMGAIITISEPDLQVLANQVAAIPNAVLIWTVAAGVGVFTAVAVLRILYRVPLSKMLLGLYLLLFVVSLFVPNEFLAVAFDAGGVTTGPMTVPFIMALGVGVSSIRGDRHAADDSFGLVAMCSIGPILAVLILGIVFRASDSTYIPPVLPEVRDSVELWQLFHVSLPTYLEEIAVSLLPIIVMFGIFQFVALHMDRRSLGRIAVGLAYTYVGLVLFLTGANVGFMPAGNYLGQVLAGQSFRWIIIPIGMLIGYFIVKAEPAVYVLNKQVEEVTDGAISAKAMGTALSAGVSISVGLAMVRVLTGVSILWFLVPGYVFAIGISFVVPKLFTAIAFDAGGVASGPMTATFLLPLAQGACVAVGGNIVTDAFGVVAMVAMTPLITVQLMGLVAQLRTRKARRLQPAAMGAAFAGLPDDDIIEL